MSLTSALEQLCVHAVRLLQIKKCPLTCHQIIAVVCLLITDSYSYATTIDQSKLHDLGNRSCNAFNITPETELSDQITTIAQQSLGSSITSQHTDIEFRGRYIGQRLIISVPGSAVLELQLLSPPTRPVRTILTEYKNSTRHDNNQPSLQLVFDSECTVQQAQRIQYSENNSAEFIQNLQLTDGKLIADTTQVWLNPPVPALANITPSRLRVAMVDSGVNYTLPAIANALARDEKGQLIGYDYWDLDNKPYDAHPARSPYFVQRHGTRTASIVISEAPGIAIVPYRYPRPDMSRMKLLIEHAHAHGVRIVGMPLGGNDYKTWSTFEQTARAHPDMLFIASAGNNGRDIDINGVYPAAMDTPNMIVVTSADDFVRPAERTNYGRIAVDYLVPAEQINALDYDGSNIKVSGSSYAVSRVVALAARLLNRQPGLSVPELMKSIRHLSIRANTGKYVSAGFIGDPLVSPANLSVSRETFANPSNTSTKYSLDVSINVLDQRWNSEQITTAIQDLNTLFKQCDVSVRVKDMNIVDAPDYLKDLSTGNMLTLRRKLGPQQLSIYFGRDTNMQPQFDAEAFGEGNTTNRRWMINSLWLTYGIKHTGIALAHELFHIVANDGGHTRTENNLMHERTDPSHTVLRADQCTVMQRNGLDAELLVKN